MKILKYHPCEIEHILRTLCILVDTREQDTVRARKRYGQFGCEFERKALKFGDYSARLTGLDGEEISLENIACIERKMDLGELCGCFCGDEECGHRGRFKRELERCAAAGAHMHLLIENDNLDNAYAGCYRSRMHPKALLGTLDSWCIKYRFTPHYISEERSGERIRDILYREARAYLEKQEMEEDA